MRLGTIALGVLLPVASVFTGCGVGKQDVLNATASTSSSAATPKRIRGKAYGGQQPVTQATIALYTFGTTDYGSTGTLLASTSTDSTGYFNIDPSQINCTQTGVTPSSPVYILSIGGNPGGQVNSSITLGASLGTCAQADNPDAFVTINEVSTAMLAYTFSRFFSVGTSDGTTNDHFGAPANAALVISNASAGTIPTLLDTTNGYPLPNTDTVTFEGAKLVTLANILGACVNSVGASSPSCSALFRLSKHYGGAAPTNTLEAAVDIAQYPSQNVARLYALQPQSGAAAFAGGLTAAPADWTLSASYTSPNFGLAVNPSTVSTIDIDTTGKVWFPSNLDRHFGAGYFDPAVGGFSPFFAAHVRHPQQIAIDADGYVWENDSATNYVAGFPTADPTAPRQLTLNGVTSNSVTIGADNLPRVGITAKSGLPALGIVTAKSYFTEIANTEISGAASFIPTSLAADPNGGIAFGAQNTTRAATRDFYYDINDVRTSVLNHAQDAGQLATLTGADYVQARGGYGSAQDGICLYSAQACYGMTVKGQRHPSGIAVDGGGNLWLADNNTSTIENIPLTNGSYLTGANLANNIIYTHDSANGGTLPAPAGIAVDGAGNVWVSNYGCYATGCTPTSFVLTQIISGGAPTVTPVSASLGITSTGTPAVQKAVAAAR